MRRNHLESHMSFDYHGNSPAFTMEAFLSALCASPTAGKNIFPQSYFFTSFGERIGHFSATFRPWIAFNWISVSIIVNITITYPNSDCILKPSRIRFCLYRLYGENTSNFHEYCWFTVKSKAKSRDKEMRRGEWEVKEQVFLKKKWVWWNLKDSSWNSQNNLITFIRTLCWNGTTPFHTHRKQLKWWKLKTWWSSRMVLARKMTQLWLLLAPQIDGMTRTRQYCEEWVSHRR